MPQRNILVLGAPSDTHVLRVVETLKSRGARPWILEAGDFPERVRAVFDGRGRGRWVFAEGELPLDQIHSVYWRNYGRVHGDSARGLLDSDQRALAENEARSLFESMLLRLRCRWVNGWEGFQLHQRKPAAFARVAALRVPMPRTLWSNDPSAIRAFVEKEGDCIFKPVQGGAYARPLGPGDLDEARLARLALAPVAIQRRVRGTNVRVYVFEKEVLACTVETEALDFREDAAAVLRPISLSPALRERCRRIARALELRWSGMDFVRDEKGVFHFLEANPSPMFLGFESRTELPLTDRLCQLLLR